jgi:YegS/Rv2252/BmrU family lipid kinase
MYKIILNPVSGRGAGAASEPAIRSFLGEERIDFDLALTERPWHAAELAKQAAMNGFDAVIAAGGDGTANEVINGLMDARKAGKDAAMGVLSVGRGNDFAFGVGVPMDLREACRVLGRNTRRAIDVGFVRGGLYPEGRYFGNGVGIGFDAVVGFEALKMKRLTGFLSYLAATLKVVFLYFRAPNVQIRHDDGELVRAALMVSIMNGRRLGGGFMMAPSGEMTDSLLDVTIATQVSRIGIFRLIPHFMKGTQATQKPIVTFRSRKVEVTALDGVLPAHADGETLCVDAKQLTVELVPAALSFIS